MFKSVTLVESLPDSILLHIFSFLDGPDIARGACVCSRWRNVAYDDSLYRALLQTVYKVKVKDGLAKGKECWRSEYKRLFYNVPTELSETLTDHTDEVLHISFSHKGHLFSTTSKDCTIKVWEVGYPTKLKYNFDFAKKFKWSFTQFSCFNSNDTRLLVSSVKSGDIDRRGFVAILSVEKSFDLLKIVCMDPSQLFGAWLNIETFLGGSLDINLDGRALVSVHIEAFNVGTSEPKGTQDFTQYSNDVIREPDDAKVLFTFCSETASLIKFLTVVKDMSSDRPINSSTKTNSVQNVMHDSNLCIGNCNCQLDAVTQAYLKDGDTISDENISACAASSSDNSDSRLIYVTGEFAVALHQVGVKLIPKDILSKPDLDDVETHMVMHVSNHEIGIRPDWKPDSSDQMIDLNGHVTGLCLSKDNRYLFVNCRPWVGKVNRDDPWNTPVLSRDIEIRVIDLWDLSDTGMRYVGHQGLSPSTMCCFVFLNTSDDYVGSGSENCRGYLWDRSYGCLLSTYQHGPGVVNAVAFNPVNQEYFVTVSDDQAIKIWRSKSEMAKLRKLENLQKK
ncbi:F-box/WD repeat-containing protein 5 [Patella vulgata]|uniref:F-box/WD repeat-containing protein 5 n=1 Tax=Patella vulgata TaxID=6465 RepID=UPI0021806A03|nr:F-box/WD repeat-containing protein 5 [Patella vulgata]XP_050400615.1 F-box/WD repeat-containing protein 5 [Patella vulgata]